MTDNTSMVVSSVVVGRDGVVQVVEISYRNHGENFNRTTKWGQGGPRFSGYSPN